VTQIDIEIGADFDVGKRGRRKGTKNKTSKKKKKPGKGK
jgi:hypothetical protein